MTADELAAKMGVRASLVESEFKATARGIAISAVKFTKEKMTREIYAIPEDKTRKGKKKWRRTGTLRRGERYYFPDPFTVVIVNDTSYAVPRHEAGKPGRRRVNPLRMSHWRDDLVETFSPLVTELYEQTVEDILKGKKR